jgi:hypothetical protein
MGYAVGALLVGIIADAIGVVAAIITVGVLTLGSALIIERRMRCRTDAIKLTEWLLPKLAAKKKHETEFPHQRVGLASCLQSE